MSASGKDQPFFIVGSDRSGSTMLRLMLNEHSRLCVPPETWFLADLMNVLPLSGPLARKQLDHALRIIGAHWRWKEWGVADSDLNACARSLKSPTLADLIDGVFRLKAAGKPRWGDKTPGYLTEMGRLHRVFPGAKFVHIVRDGRDVCLSLRRTGWEGDTTWSIAQYWSKHVGTGFRQGRLLPQGHYLEVAYSDLVLKTEETLRRVCAFLGEGFEPDMLNFYKRAEQETPERERSYHSKTRRSPRQSDVDRWRREMSAFHVLIFEAGAAETMKSAGQSLKFPLRSWLFRPLCMAIGQAAVATLPVRKKFGLHLHHVRRLF
jgi:hypothetical protein